MPEFLQTAKGNNHRADLQAAQFADDLVEQSPDGPAARASVTERALVWLNDRS